jgi:D-serine dehydratase
VSAGGSGVFDLVVPRLRVSLAKPVTGLLRSGCYVTHDQGHYQRLVHAVYQRLGCDDAQGLRAALEVWALVQSLPEPGLAILAVGKRDISYDLGMPVPLATCARASRERVPVPEGWSVQKLNDQHAYLHLTSDTHGLRVGDRVCLGISHPCTTFDKWRWMPIVDDDYTVVDAIVTCF